MRTPKIPIIVLAATAVIVGGCDLLDPARPTIQPDTEVFGNIVSVEEVPDDPGVWDVQIRVGPPKALNRAEAEQGREGPGAEKGLTAQIKVNADTIVLMDGAPALLDDFSPGTEVVSLPKPGTTRMLGENVVMHDADFFADFETYRRWRLPGLAAGPETLVDDPSLINTSGAEHAPVPLDGGRILYFTASMRQGIAGIPVGAARDGLEPADGENGRNPERSFRTELRASGWSAPERVVFPGLETAPSVRVSWVDPTETLCLVTVVEGGEREPWAGRSKRSSATSAWGPVTPIDALGEGDAFDPIFLAGSRTKILFVTGRQGANQTDLFLLDPANAEEAMPLEPRINSIGSEWGPRVGPDNELFFTRGDRPLMYQGGMVHSVYLDWPHRVFFFEVAPTDDGQWAFLTTRRFNAGEPDLDIWVAERREDGSLGFPVAVDAWRPDAE